jgi:hypothetical protein
MPQKPSKSAKGRYVQLIDFVTTFVVVRQICKFIIKFYVNYEFSNNLLRKLKMEGYRFTFDVRLLGINFSEIAKPGQKHCGLKAGINKKTRITGWKALFTRFQNNSCERNQAKDTVHCEMKRKCESYMGQYFGSKICTHR